MSNDIHVTPHALDDRATREFTDCGYTISASKKIDADVFMQSHKTMIAGQDRLSSRSSDTARDIAYSHIKQKILDNDYTPGSQILEQTISSELGFSRTPVREALVRLEQEGLLRIVPRHGVEILSLSADDMREIYELLTCLEPKAVEILASLSPSLADVKALADACDAMEAALLKEDRLAWAMADEKFHLGLVDLCKNKRLAQAVMSFWEQTHRVRMFTLKLRPLPVESTKEHRAVLDAILSGDASLAKALYEAHRMRSQIVLTDILREFTLNRM